MSDTNHQAASKLSVELLNSQGQRAQKISDWLEATHRGDSKAAEQLLPELYPQLRKLAARKMAKEPHGHTLQATALVHEAYLRIAGDGAAQWENPRHFYAAAAEAMRRILIERARRKNRIRHGGEFGRTPLEEDRVEAPRPEEDILAIDSAVSHLEEVDSRAAEVVKLRYFAGLTHSEIAECLDVAPRTVDNLWSFARAWLLREIERDRNQ